MKLLNYTTGYFAGLLLLIISIWAAVFYFSMLDEIYDSIDDGLDNQKHLIIQKAAVDPSLLKRASFEEGGYAIKELPPQNTLKTKDVYADTCMYMQNEDEFEPVRLLKTDFEQQGRFYELQVYTSMVEEDDLIRELLLYLLWLYLGLVITILLLNNLLLKRIWGPFYRILDRLKNFRLEKPEPVNGEKTRVTEFRLLNTVIQKLLQDNIDAYVSQKHFIENAAHELQTPLAVSQNKLELLAEEANLSEEQGKLLTDVMENLERLGRLNKSLLLLFRIENRQFIAEVRVNINDLVKKILQDFDSVIEFKQLSVHLVEEAPCMQTMNADLAAVLTGNLIKNAIVHNHHGGSIEITISQKHFVIENSGGQKDLDKVHLFDRFYKGTQSLTSTGLGLAIVKAICELYHCGIHYDYSGRHRFALRFS